MHDVHGTPRHGCVPDQRLCATFLFDQVSPRSNGIEVEHVKTIKQKMSSTQSVILASTEQLQTPNQRKIEF